MRHPAGARSLCGGSYHQLILETRPGDYIRITDVIPHSYGNELSLSATANSRVEKTESPLLASTKTLIGVSFADGTVDLLLDDDQVLTANAELLQEDFPNLRDLEHLTEVGPKMISLEMRGSEIIAVSSASNEQELDANVE